MTNAEDNMYIVLRNGIPTSGKIHQTENDSDAILEINQWNRILNKFPDGTKIKIKTINKRQH